MSTLSLTFYISFIIKIIDERTGANCRSWRKVGYIRLSIYKMSAGRRPRIMFVTDEKVKEALETWAQTEGRTVSSLLDELVKEVLVRKGYIEAPKKLLGERMK